MEKALFTLKDTNGNLLKYTLKDKEGNYNVFFNVPGTQLRFQTCGSEKTANKFLEIVTNAGIEASIVTFSKDELNTMQEDSKNFPRTQKGKLPEPKPAKEKKVKTITEPEVTPEPEVTETTPEVTETSAELAE